MPGVLLWLLHMLREHIVSCRYVVGILHEEELGFPAPAFSQREAA